MLSILPSVSSPYCHGSTYEIVCASYGIVAVSVESDRFYFYRKLLVIQHLFVGNENAMLKFSRMVKQCTDLTCEQQFIWVDLRTDDTSTTRSIVK